MLRKKYYTKGQMEADISDGIAKFEKDFMGRGPLEVKSYIVEDMIIVRLTGILSRSEMTFLSSSHKERGRDIIKQLRSELLDSGRGLLETMIKSITRRKICSLHTDLSTVTGEKILVLILEKSVEFDKY